MQLLPGPEVPASWELTSKKFCALRALWTSPTLSPVIFFTIHNFRVQCYSSTHLLYCWSCFRGSCGPFSSESPSPEHANRLPSLSTCNPTISESVYPTFSFLNFPTDLTDYFPANKTNMLANTLYNKSSFPTKRQEFLNVFSWHQVIFSDKGHFFSRA